MCISPLQTFAALAAGEPTEFTTDHTIDATPSETFDPVVPAWAGRPAELDLSPATPSKTPIEFTHPCDNWIEDWVNLLTRRSDGYEALAVMLVLNAFDWTLPRYNWWHAGLAVAEDFTAFGKSMLGHTLAMLDLVWHADEPLSWGEAEVLSWACLVDPDAEPMSAADARHIIDYIEQPDREKLAYLYCDYPTWLPVAAKLVHARALGKLTAIRATGRPVVDENDLIQVLSQNARAVTGKHMPMFW